MPYNIIVPAIFIIVVIACAISMKSISAERKIKFCAALFIALYVFPMYQLALFYFRISPTARVSLPDEFMDRYVYDTMKITMSTACEKGDNGGCLPINNDGLVADRDYAIPKKDGTFRVILLGDSFAAGYGLKYRETLAVQLGKLSGANAEFINMAFYSANTESEVDYFLRKGAKYGPDLIIIRHRIDDIFPVSELFYEDGAYKIIGAWPYWPKFLKNKVFKLEASVIRAKYQRYFMRNQDNSLEESTGAPLDRLHEYTRQKNTGVLIVEESCEKNFAAVCGKLEQKASEFGWNLLNLDKNGEMNLKARDMILPMDGHPSARANELIASSIFEYMKTHYDRFREILPK